MGLPFTPGSEEVVKAPGHAKMEITDEDRD